MLYRILIVEDDVLVAGALASVLRDAGYRVTCAASFEQGRELLAEEPPDLLITDLRLGAFNGLHLLVRSRKDYPDMPGILMTGFPDPVLAAEAEHLGAVYMLKPVHSHTLQHQVGSLLHGRRPRRRWVRRQPSGCLRANVADHCGHIVDASYGGVCLELDARDVGERTVEVYVPAIDRILPGKVVWERRVPGSTTARIGVELQRVPADSTRTWRALVDAGVPVGGGDAPGTVA